MEMIRMMRKSWRRKENESKTIMLCRNDENDTHAKNDHDINNSYNISNNDNNCYNRNNGTDDYK